MEIIKSNKGGEKICYGGYMYVIHRECKQFIRWRCFKVNTFKCKGALKTTLGKSDPIQIADHNHPADKTGVEVTKTVQEMKRRAKDTLGKPLQLYAETVQNINDTIRARMPLEDSMKRTLRNQKSKVSPLQPNSLKDLTIEGDWATTGEVGNRFLLNDNGQDAEERVIIFATDSSLNHLSESNEWYMDGNFSLAPPLFKQLYVIRIRVNNCFITAAYCLLERKSQATYEEMLRSILSKCAERDLYPDPVIIHVDFERAAIQAIKNVVGEHVNIKGCFYHLTQSTHRKIQELGLEVAYRENEELNLFCGMLDGLAFLPVDEVRNGMNFLKEHVPPQLDALVEYFDATYVSGTYRRVGANAGGDIVRLRNVAPIFPPPLWNVRETTINDQDRTNNQTEGWNHRFSNLVGHKHPTIWVQRSYSSTKSASKRKKKKKCEYENLQERLKNLCLQHESGERDNESFLRAIGHTIRFNME